MSARPYDLYIRFLVTQGIDEFSDVNKHLDQLALPRVDPSVVRKQYELVQDHLPVMILNQIEKKVYTSDFVSYMGILEISDLWKYKTNPRNEKNRWLKLVYDIHSDPSLRIAINCLLMKGVKHDEISEVLNMRYASMLKPRHIDLYKKIFWDFARMTRGAWRTLLNDVDPSEKALLFTALTEPLDVVKTELSLPAQISLSDSLQYLFSASFQKAKQYLRENTPGAGNEAREWIKTVSNLADKYDKHRTGDITDFGKTLQMEFEFVDNDFPTPDTETLAALEVEATERRKKEDERRAVTD